MSETTVAKIGRSMKNLENMRGARYFAPRLVAAASPPSRRGSFAAGVAASRRRRLRLVRRAFAGGCSVERAVDDDLLAGAAGPR